MWHGNNAHVCHNNDRRMCTNVGLKLPSMATHTVYTEESLRAINRARAKKGLGPLDQDDEEEEEVHWVYQDRPSDESVGTTTWRYTLKGAFAILAGVDYVGEALAYFLGITSPKYQFAIDELIAQQREEDEEAEAMQELQEQQRKAQYAVQDEAEAQMAAVDESTA
eukprot:m.7374 g.7374  ORF g.7374 m.7374 type:complete len:166 (+) comp5241_c0_seq1:171-668(+)